MTVHPKSPAIPAIRETPSLAGRTPALAVVAVAAGEVAEVEAPATVVPVMATGVMALAASFRAKTPSMAETASLVLIPIGAVAHVSRARPLVRQKKWKPRHIMATQFRAGLFRNCRE